MSVPFPSLAFFEALRKRLSQDPVHMANVPGSEAYCGFAIDGRLFVFEFEGSECVATVQGGNLLDLDFVLAGSAETWRKAAQTIAEGNGQNTLVELVDNGALEVRSEDPNGNELARAALPFLGAFLAQAEGFEIEFD